MIHSILKHDVVYVLIIYLLLLVNKQIFIVLTASFKSSTNVPYNTGLLKFVTDINLHTYVVVILHVLKLPIKFFHTIMVITSDL